jgi:hypothetical protein
MVQWTEPVTGSSSLPECGAKKRETTSHVSPGAVMTRPRGCAVSIARRSGRAVRTATSSGSRASSKVPATKPVTGTPPSRSDRPAGGGPASPGIAGKSSAKRPCSARATVSVPLLLAKRRRSPAKPNRSNSTAAVASVA